MALLLADSLVPYSAVTDMVGLWDSASGFSFSTGRFTGGRSLVHSNGSSVAKSSGSNDGTHHLVFAVYPTTQDGSAGYGWAFIFYDGATAQCYVNVDSRGYIVVGSGGTVGSNVKATYSAGALSLNVWTALEIEVKVHASAGEIHVRKNGNTSDDFSATGLVTATSGNNYANKLTITGNGNSGHYQGLLTDFLWFSTSGAAPNTWVGDVRSSWLAPASDSSVQFTAQPVTHVISSGVSYNHNRTSGTVSAMAFTADITGTIGTATVQIGSGFTGNIKAAIYNSASSQPATVNGSASNAVTNPSAGVVIFIFASPPSVVKGTQYWLAIDQDTTVNVLETGSFTCATFTQAYGSFPASASGVSLGYYQAIACTVTITPTVNATEVSEPQNDGATTYVYSSTAGQVDLYALSPLPSTPVAIIAVQARMIASKSDSGTRTAAVEMSSGGTVVDGTTAALGTTFGTVAFARTTDPATSAAWTASAVNALLVGPKVVA